MSTSFIRIATACTLTAALMMSSTSVIALEKTATREVDQASTDLNTDMKVAAFTEAIKAAVQALIDRVNLFDGRIDTLEAWRPVIQAEVDALKIKVDYLYDTWKPWVEGQISSLNASIAILNTRITSLESSGGTSEVDQTQCTESLTKHRVMFVCANGTVMAGFAPWSLTTGSKQFTAKIRCCALKAK